MLKISSKRRRTKLDLLEAQALAVRELTQIETLQAQVNRLTKEKSDLNIKLVQKDFKQGGLAAPTSHAQTKQRPG